jgi:hypothetical protein
MRPTLLMAVENDHGHLKTAYPTGGEGGLGLGQLSGIIRDIKHNGRNEVMLSDALEPFAGTAPTPYLMASSCPRTASFLTTTRTKRCASVTRNSMTYCSTAHHPAPALRNENIIEKALLPSKRKSRH